MNLVLVIFKKHLIKKKYHIILIMGHAFSKDMDSVWHWMTEGHCSWGKELCSPAAQQELANNMYDSSMLNQYGSTNPEEATSSNESAYWWNRLQNALPNQSLKLPHLHQADNPANSESNYDTALIRNRIGKVGFIHY